MSGEKRRDRLLQYLEEHDKPVSGTELAKEFGVSRQVIVQDIALLRTGHVKIIATNRGYLVPPAKPSGVRRIFKCRHTDEQAEDELTCIVDLGGIVENVFVNHKIYGKIQADMNIRCRRDIKEFIAGIKSGKSTLLKNVTSDYHYHTVTAEEERNLAIRMSDYNDVDAAQALIISHLRLVISVARGYLGYGLSHGDLIQEGNIGLMKAVRHYDPDKGVRLMTFAVHWIRAEIQEYIVWNSHMVKLATTHAQRKLFFNLRQMKKTDQALTNAQAEDIAEKLNVKPKEVLEMEKRLSGPDASLDTPLDEEGDSSVTAVDMLSDKSDEPVEILEKAD